MTTPFLALAPFIPRVANIEYQAFAPACVSDVTDLTDVTDNTDHSDVTDDSPII
jgi:hypothetical protein